MYTEEWMRREWTHWAIVAWIIIMLLSVCAMFMVAHNKQFDKQLRHEIHSFEKNGMQCIKFRNASVCSN